MTDTLRTHIADEIGMDITADCGGREIADDVLAIIRERIERLRWPGGMPLADAYNKALDEVLELLA